MKITLLILTVAVLATATAQAYHVDGLVSELREAFVVIAGKRWTLDPSNPDYDAQVALLRRCMQHQYPVKANIRSHTRVLIGVSKEPRSENSAPVPDPVQPQPAPVPPGWVGWNYKIYQHTFGWPGLDHVVAAAGGYATEADAKKAGDEALARVIKYGGALTGVTYHVTTQKFGQ